MTDPVVFNDRDPGPEIRRKLNLLGVDFAYAVDNAVGPAGPQGPKGDKGDIGDTGPQGVQGIQGPKGDKGDTGDTGPQGLTGPQGAKGDRGDSFTVDAVGVEADKPDYIGEAIGFYFLATDTGLLYIIVSAGVWSAGVPFGKGETGDTGPEGAQGPQGIQGIQGIQGPKGDTGDTGPAGTTTWAGITDKPAVIVEGDSRLTDSRTPSGGAGGVLSGSYPNPGFAVDMATQGELDAVASTVASKLSDAPSDGKTYGRKDAAWTEMADSGMPSYTYDQRGSLRASGGQFAVVDGLGLFQHITGSDEPDDDESCFATITGRWLLQALHWDVVDTYVQPEIDAAAAAAAAAAAKFLHGTATCAIESIADNAYASFTGTVTGATPGDRVIATPPASLAEPGYLPLSYHAWVSADNTVSIMLVNNNSSVAYVNPPAKAAWPITVIKD